MKGKRLGEFNTHRAYQKTRESKKQSNNLLDKFEQMEEQISQ